MEAAYPIAILEDRYRGAYSGGLWLAVARADEMDAPHWKEEFGRGPYGDDAEAREFWADPPDWIAVGHTPDDALRALARKQPKAVSLSADRWVRLEADNAGLTLVATDRETEVAVPISREAALILISQLNQKMPRV